MQAVMFLVEGTHHGLVVPYIKGVVFFERVEQRDAELGLLVDE
jgi:hypothetical protein